MTLLKRLVVLLVLLTALTAMAGKKAAASLEFTVIRDNNGKPVRNAEIVLHPIDKNGRQKDEGLELKTHEDGKCAVTGIPYGKMRIQVIAPGFKTYGEDYEINQPSHEFTIKLQKPADQYSIYK